MTDDSMRQTQQTADCAKDALPTRRAALADLPALNGVIEAAVMAWPLAERLKRLALPVLRYGELDLRDYVMDLVERDDRVVAVAAWREVAEDAGHGPHLFLHGLYVHPDFQKRSLGSGLIRRVVAIARERGLRGVLVKAERVSTGYFDALGFERLPESDAPGAAYPYRYWLELPTP